MKMRPYCRDCLKKLAGQVVALSGGREGLLEACFRLVDEDFHCDRSPTVIANRLLKYVKEQTGVYDPYAEKKDREFETARAAAAALAPFFPDTLEGALRSSAFGNGGDFFLEHRYDTREFLFTGDVDKIARAVYISTDVLILGDNPGDFVFDQPLVRLLKKQGKHVFYAVKEHPVQNDMSMADVRRFRAAEMCPDIISTGTDEVGIRKEEMKGGIRRLWEKGALVMAKGMGNYETVSEFGREGTVVYIMKVKCESVAEALRRSVGEYIAILGG